MADFRIIHAYINTERNILVDSEGQRFNEDFRLYRAESVLLKIQLYDDNATAISVPDKGVSDYAFGIDDLFTVNHADYVTANDSTINLAQDSWADPVNGKVSIRANLNTTELETAMTAAGDPASIDMHMGLWITPTGGNPLLVFHIPIKMMNITVEPDSPTASVLDTANFVTTDVIEQYYDPTHPSGDFWRVRIKNGQGVTVLDLP